jgi:hypothetical protein
MSKLQTPKVMRTYATLCGLVLARAHDKAGDAAMIAGYLGKAVRSGRLKSDLSPSRLATALR